MLYDHRYHLHVGYYKNGFDLEAAAYKRKSEDIRDIFFDFEHEGLKNDPEKELDGLGTKIFSIKAKELEYFEVAKKFEQWLFDQKIIKLLDP
ncbi:DUF3986 family protein [Mesobacillus maritimus]|uniref:DUF3986 family protein n=1 Tax=Mesobacillus maritimus TaxID=1643336 RepID=UPI00204245A7|nr:DUF3986 family protein [Mesobacillus maritimus]MCM3670529.1 DUF3986 family protein [Mesobacillus maritimus]